MADGKNEARVGRSMWCSCLCIDGRSSETLRLTKGVWRFMRKTWDQGYASGGSLILRRWGA